MSEKGTCEEDYCKDRSWYKFATDLWFQCTWNSFIEDLRSRYLKDCYLSGLMDEDDNKRRVHLQDCFVNLKHMKRDTPEKDPEVIDFEDLLDGETLTFKDVFKKEDILKRQPTGWAFIVGSAGTGKSTLLQYVSYRWAVKDSWWNNRFDFVFRVRLNHLTRFEKEYEARTGLDGLSWLIYRSLEEGNNRQITVDNIKVCLEKHKDGTLLLLDGFDEIYSRYQSGSIVSSIINLAMRFPNGILTARPRTIPENRLPVGKKVRWFENLGLKKEQVEVFIKSYFSSLEHGNERRESLSAQLSSNPEMMSLAQIPVNLSAMCLLWSQEQKSISCTSELYRRVVMLLARRYVSAFKLSKEEKDAGANVTTMIDEEILKRCKEEFNALSALSYEAFVVARQVQTIDSKLLKKHFPIQQMLINISDRFGLLRPAESIPILCGYSPHYFIHLTYQEYFVAYYIAQKLSQANSGEFESVRKLIKDNKDSSDYKVTWKFVSGLISSTFPASSKYFWEAFLSDIISSESADAKVIGFHETTLRIVANEDIIREGVLLKMISQLVPMMRSLILWETERHCFNLLWKGVLKDKDKREQRRRYQLLNDLMQLEGKAVDLAVFELFQDGEVEIVWDPSTIFHFDHKRSNTLYNQTASDLEKLATGTTGMVKIGAAEALRSLDHGGNMTNNLHGKEILVNELFCSSNEELFTELAMLLVDSNPEIRASTMFVVLEKMKSGNGIRMKELLRRLFIFLDCGEVEVEMRAVEALRSLEVVNKNVISYFLISLRHTNNSTSVRNAVIAVLKRIGVGNVDLARRLMLLLDDPSYVQWSVIEILGRLKVVNTEIIEKLVMLLDSHDNQVRSAAADALGRLGSGFEEVLKRLWALFVKQDDTLRTKAMEAVSLLGLGNENVLQGILSLLEDSNFTVQCAAVETVARVGVHREEALRELLLLFKEKGYRFKSNPENHFIRIGKGNEDLIKALLVLLEDRESCVQCSAVRILGHVGVGNSEILAKMMLMLEHPNTAVQQAAIEALGGLGLGNEEVARRMLMLLNGQSEDQRTVVQISAAKALGRLGIGNEEVVMKLLSLLESPNSPTRCNGIDALVRLGVGKQEVLRAIIVLLEDKDKYIRNAAEEALAWLVVHESIITLFCVLLEEEDASCLSTCVKDAVELLTALQVGDKPAIEQTLSLLEHQRPIAQSSAIQGMPLSVGEDRRWSEIGKGKGCVFNKLPGMPEDPDSTAIIETIRNQEAINDLQLHLGTIPGRLLFYNTIEALGAGNQDLLIQLKCPDRLVCLEEMQFSNQKLKDPWLEDLDVLVGDEDLEVLGKLYVGNREGIPQQQPKNTLFCYNTTEALRRLKVGIQEVPAESHLTQLKNRDPVIRRRAIEGLGRVGEEAIIRRLREVEGLPDGPVRWEAGVRMLPQNLDFSDTSLRCKAVDALEMLGVGFQVLVASFLQEPAHLDTSVCRKAIETLGTLGVETQVAITRLLHDLENGEFSVRCYAREALRRLGVEFHERIKRCSLNRDLCHLSDTSILGKTIEALGRLGAGFQEDITRLLQNLESPDTSIRCKAVEALGWLGIGFQPRVKRCEMELGFSDISVRWKAIEKLGTLRVGFQEAITRLMLDLESPHTSIRCKARVALGRLGVGFQEPIFRLLCELKLSDPCVRCTAIDALLTLTGGFQNATGRLLRELDFPDISVRCKAVEAIGRLGVGTQEATLRLRQKFDFPDLSVRCRVVEALGSLSNGFQEAIIRLLQELDFPDISVRCKAVEALGKLGVGIQEATEDRTVQLKNRDPFIRCKAVEGLGWLGVGNQEAIINLLQQLESPDPSVRCNAIQALGRLGVGNQEVIRRFLQWLDVPDISSLSEYLGNLEVANQENVRRLLQELQGPDISFLSEYLGKLVVGNQEFIIRLLKQLENLDISVRCKTIDALGRVGVGNQEVLSRILQLLDDPVQSICLKTVVALGYLGAIDAERVIKKILPLLRSTDDGTRSSAARALLRLGIGNKENLRLIVDLPKDPIFMLLTIRNKLKTLSGIVEVLGRLGVANEEVVSLLTSVAKGEFHANGEAESQPFVEHAQYAATVALGRLDFTGYQFPLVQSLHSSLRSQSIRMKPFFTFTDSTSIPHGEIKLDRTTPVEDLTDLFVRLRRAVQNRPDQFLSLPVDVLRSPAALYGLVVSVWMHRANLIRSESGLVLNGKEYPIESSELDSIWTSLLQQQEEFFRATGMGDSLRTLNQPTFNLDGFQSSEEPVAQDTNSGESAAFLSHDWGSSFKILVRGKLEKRYPKHERVAKVHHALKGRGMLTWIDNKRIRGGDRLFYKIVDGINMSSCFIVFVTRNYMNKVNGTDTTDACQCEFNYAIQQKKRMIAVIMEEDMKDMSKWEGVFAMLMGWTFYLNFCDIDENDSVQFDKFFAELKEAIEKS